ncbi:MAG: toxin-antitoxin system YwqK family antitoxin, partial [Myxococcota bacterium]|nr:toxin-antitoxin system YwqK family antitoxin [Myxococcota bacterium]
MKQNATNDVNDKGYMKHIAWHENGQKQFEVEFVNGERHGAETSWWENGKKQSEGELVNGKPHGTIMTWHENGKKQFEGEFVSGEAHGKALSWHENGQKQSEGEFVNGKLHGKYTAWYENGKKQSEGEFVNGQRYDKSCSWHANGQKKNIFLLVLSLMFSACGSEDESQLEFYSALQHEAEMLKEGTKESEKGSDDAYQAGSCDKLYWLEDEEYVRFVLSSGAVFNPNSSYYDVSRKGDLYSISIPGG